REFNQEGNWETRKSKRVAKLDQEGNQIYNAKGWRETKSIKLNDWDSKKKLLEWRENWSALLNEKSRKHGLDRNYSHKSFEEQGRIEKPEIRLTREEYQFEQRQKERSEKKGIEYQPTTFYAKKNEEVKAYNRSLSSVLHLQDYKTEESFNELFKQVRRRNVYNQEKIEATKKIAERAKEYVDFPVAKKVYTDFHSPTNKWKQKLERDVHNLNAKKSFIKGLIHDYAEDPSSALKYGYSIDNFKEEVGEELQRLEKQQQDFQEEQEKYRELKQASALSLAYQQELLKQEFEAVYQDDYHLSYEEMDYAVELMKDYQIKLPVNEIEDEYRKSNQRHLNTHVPAWKQAKNTLVTLNIYDSTLRKLENQKHLSPQNLKNNHIKYDTFHRLKEQYVNTLQELAPWIDEEIKQAFPEHMNDDILEQADVETKSFLLEKYHVLSEEEQQSIINIDHFMKEALEESKSNYHTINQLQKTNENHYDKEDYQTQSDKYRHIAEGIVSMFQEMAKQRSPDRSKNNRDRTKTFRRKGTDGRVL